MELQLTMEVWDCLSELNGRYWNKFEAKRTSGLCDGCESAGSALFCKKKVIWCFGRLEGSTNRVSGSRQCTKLVWNVGKS